MVLLCSDILVITINMRIDFFTIEIKDKDSLNIVRVCVPIYSGSHLLHICGGKAFQMHLK